MAARGHAAQPLQLGQRLAQLVELGSELDEQPAGGSASCARSCRSAAALQRIAPGRRSGPKMSSPTAAMIARCVQVRFSNTELRRCARPARAGVVVVFPVCPVSPPGLSAGVLPRAGAAAPAVSDARPRVKVPAGATHHCRVLSL